MPNVKHREYINGKKLIKLMKNYNLCHPVYLKDLDHHEKSSIEKKLKSELSLLMKPDENNSEIWIDTISSILKKYDLLLDKSGLTDWLDQVIDPQLFITEILDRSYRIVPDTVGNDHITGRITLDYLSDLTGKSQTTVKDWRRLNEIDHDDYGFLCESLNVNEKYLKDECSSLSPEHDMDFLDNESLSNTRLIRKIQKERQYTREFYSSLNRIDDDCICIDFYGEIEDSGIIASILKIIDDMSQTAYLSKYRKEIASLSEVQLYLLSLRSISSIQKTIEEYLKGSQDHGHN